MAGPASGLSPAINATALSKAHLLAQGAVCLTPWWWWWISRLLREGWIYGWLVAYGWIYGWIYGYHQVKHLHLEDDYVGHRWFL